MLHPHYLNPVPSMAVARFDVDPERGKLTSGHTVAEHTPLFAEHGARGTLCRFRTCYPVTLWPLCGHRAGFEPSARFDFLDSLTDVASVLA